MYNRYVRNDNGEYQRIPVLDSPPPGPPPPPPPSPPPPPPETGDSFFQGSGPHYGHEFPGGRKNRGSFLTGLLKQLNLEHIDTGDLLLILILLLLFQDGEDEEMLIALGLLLIL